MSRPRGTGHCALVGRALHSSSVPFPNRRGAPMTRPRPLPLDDDEPTPKPSARAVYGVLKWVCVGAGAVLALVALKAPGTVAATLAGLACFAGVLGRVLQVEQHARS